MRYRMEECLTAWRTKVIVLGSDLTNAHYLLVCKLTDEETLL